MTEAISIKDENETGQTANIEENSRENILEMAKIMKNYQKVKNFLHTFSLKQNWVNCRNSIFMKLENFQKCSKGVSRKSSKNS